MHVLEDILEKRGSAFIGGNPLTFIEKLGGLPVSMLIFEPDPVSFRSDYYYNTRENVLYKRIFSKPKPVWKRIGG